MLGIFLAVAIVIVGRIQFGLSQAQAREREAIFMYELSAALAGRQTAKEVARTLAGHIQQLYQADLVQISIKENGHSITTNAPQQGRAERKPDLVLPILSAAELLGEICVWQGGMPLPSPDNRLVQNFANQGALALERARLAQIEA